MALKITTKTYFEQRLTELNISVKDAARHGLDVDKQGNIIQEIRTFQGNPVLWQDRTGRNARKIERIRNRKTGTEGTGEEQYNRKLTLTRYTPENLESILKQNPGAGKYKYPSKKVTGYGALPMPSMTAIDAFRAHITGGTGAGIEGYFKAVALALNGVEATAFTGNTTYKLEGMEEYFLQRKLDDFVIMYDGDALQLSKRQTEVISSNRVLQFYNSAVKFAEQFHNFCKRHNLKTRLHFCMVATEAKYKGVDDLLAAHAKEEQEKIIHEWRTLKTGEYFKFVRLGKTTYKRNLDSFFGVANHADFYRRHAALIRDRPFRFGGATYQLTVPERHFNLMEYQQGHRFFSMLENPFRVEMPAEKLYVGKWITEATKQLDSILKDTARVCIEAPTGTGKTSYFLGHQAKGRNVPGYFQRAGVQGVVAVPTVMLAKQLASKYRVPAFHGTVSLAQKEEAANAPAIVCTYDTLHHVHDLQSRVLIVDEAHNLVNQYGEIKKNKPFRADTLRRVVEQFDIAKKTVLISATPPRALARDMDFYYVDIQRKENNLANVYTIEAENSGHQALTEEVVSELQRLNWRDGRVHFVYYNHAEQLEFIRDHLVSTGVLDCKDITIITREQVDSGHRIYNQIVKKEEITGVRLILTTCLMAEGVNINNSDIGNIYTVAINCVDSFRQFVARFRKMESLNVYDIRPPERRLPPEFFLSGELQAKNLKAIAAAQWDEVESLARVFAEEWPADTLPFYDSIKPDYPYNPAYFEYVYQTGEGRHAIDNLRIFAAIRERMLDTGNNCFFYSQLSKYPSIKIQGAKEKAGDDRGKVVAAMQETTEIRDQIKAQKLAELREQLTARPGVVVSACYLHVTKSNSRHAKKRIKTLAGNLITHEVETEAREYLQAHVSDFSQKWFKDLINRFLRLHFAGVDRDTIQQKMEAGKQEFARWWRRWKTYMEFTAYDNRGDRLAFTDLHKAEIRFRKRALEFIRDNLDSAGKIRSDKLTKLLNAKATRVKFAASLAGVESQSIVMFDEAKAEKLVYALFNVAREDRFRGFKVYTLRELEQPPTGSCTTKEFLALYK